MAPSGEGRGISTAPTDAELITVCDRLVQLHQMAWWDVKAMAKQLTLIDKSETINTPVTLSGMELINSVLDINSSLKLTGRPDMLVHSALTTDSLDNEGWIVDTQNSGITDAALVHQSDGLICGEMSYRPMRRIAWQTGCPEMDLRIDYLHGPLFTREADPARGHQPVHLCSGHEKWQVCDMRDGIATRMSAPLSAPVPISDNVFSQTWIRETYLDGSRYPGSDLG
jgi:hypothetical protein